MHYLEVELEEGIKNGNLFQWLQEGSLDGLWYWDLENPEVEWMSDRFWEVFGYEPGEHPHTSEWWQANIHPDDLKVVEANLEAHKKDPDHPFDQIVRYKHKLGHTVWVRCRGIIVRDDSGKPVRMLGAHTDVTALISAQMSAAQAAEVLSDVNNSLACKFPDAIKTIQQVIDDLRVLSNGGD